jgi:hypothetical protein
MLVELPGFTNINVALGLEFRALSRTPLVPTPKVPRYGIHPWVTGWADIATLNDCGPVGVLYQPRLIPLVLLWRTRYFLTRLLKSAKLATEVPF